MDTKVLESISENHGIAFLSDADRKIYSVGISTDGLAEIKMVNSCKERHVIATTIDPNGAEFVKQQIKMLRLADQIDVRIEDVSQPLPYRDGHFDYIYARLVLHYLPKDALSSALAELYRILRTGGKLFVVVRSTDCPQARANYDNFDEATGLTTYTYGGKGYSRYFHTQKSIKHYLTLARFSIAHIDTYQEHICIDFHRRQHASQVTNLIEILSSKR